MGGGGSSEWQGETVVRSPWKRPLFALCLLSGVWQLVRSLTPNMVFTQAVTLCNPYSFFGTYNMLHVQLTPMGHLSCMLLSLVLSKPMTPFQGMHDGNTLGILASLRLCCLWFRTCTTVMSISWRMVTRVLVCIRIVGLNKVAPLSPLLFSLYINNIDDIAEGISGAITGTAGVHVSHMLYADGLTLLTKQWAPWYANHAESVGCVRQE